MRVVEWPAQWPAEWTHRERVGAPWWWWLLASALVASVGVAFAGAIGPWGGLGITLLLGGMVTALLLGWSTTLVLDETGLRVGRSHLGWEWVGEAVAHDRRSLHRRLGPDADARAFTTVRPWGRSGVEVAVADRADPHPYWVFTTQHPRRVVAIIRRAVSVSV